MNRALLLLAFVFALSPLACANAIGHLNLSNCAGGGFTFTATTIDFLLPVGGGNGCDLTGSGTSITYSGGTLGPGVMGSIKDLTAGGGSVDQFLTFTGTTLDFVLTGVGPGVANTNCAGLLLGQSCSVAAGSPFVLTLTSTGTTLSLAMFGTVTEGGAWSGPLSTQFAGLTPAQIKSTVLGGGSETSTWSASFSVSSPPSVPEPSALVLLGTGLAAIAGTVRRKLVR